MVSFSIQSFTACLHPTGKRVTIIHQNDQFRGYKTLTFAALKNQTWIFNFLKNSL
jgi:thioredoxin reductase